MFGELRHRFTLNRKARAIFLGEDDAGFPGYAWVVIEDGNKLVSCEDDERLARRIALAAGLYGLSAAQTALARLRVDDHVLAAAADAQNVSVNALRTQLRRIFDRTGAPSQSALVHVLLSAEAPTKQPAL
jgi:DNA-binding CsgD family transcriptional regulator